MLPPINLQLHDNHPSLPFPAMVGCHVLGILLPAPSSATHFCFLPHRRSIIVALVAGRRPHSPPNCQPQKPCSHCHLLHPCCNCQLPIVFIAPIDGWLLCSPPPLMPPPLVLSMLCLCLSMYNLSASQCPTASCPLAPLLWFASCSPAGCGIASCCAVFTSRCAAASCIHSLDPPFVCAG